MWTKLVVAHALLVGGFCSAALLAQDAARPRPEAGGERAGSAAAGRRRTGERTTAGLRKPQPRLGDFAGLWRGKAVDYPEDGGSTDPVGIKLTVSEGGQLEGIAFDEFAGGEETRLEDVYVVGDRLEFKVRYRTGVKMRVTLGLARNKLKGEGIPIRSDEDRCHITLERSEGPERPGHKAADMELAGAERFDGRWVGVVKDKPDMGDFRHSLIADIAVDKHAGTMQIITTGDYQQASDDHIDDAKIQNGKLTFQLVDREGGLATISLWSQPGERNRLWGESVPRNDAAPVRDVELTRADGRREYKHCGGYRRLVVDTPVPSTGTASVEDASWGKAVSGIQMRLRVDRTKWPMGELPKLKVDLRNTGGNEFKSLIPATYYWELELDGRWYWSKVVFRGATAALPFEPGTQRNDLTISLEKHMEWVSKKEGKPLEFSPGKHTVRVGICMLALRQDDEVLITWDAEKRGEVIKSLPIEIEILPAATSTTQRGRTANFF